MHVKTTQLVIYDLPFLSEQATRNILGENARKLFKLETVLSETTIRWIWLGMWRSWWRGIKRGLARVGLGHHHNAAARPPYWAAKQ